MTDEEMKNSLERHKLWQSEFDAGFKAGYESLRDWTPCAEGLPIRPDGKDIKRDWYIVTLETGMVTLRAYEFDERSPFGYGFHEQNIIPVIAWQPLPAAWKEPENV